METASYILRVLTALSVTLFVGVYVYFCVPDPAIEILTSSTSKRMVQALLAGIPVLLFLIYLEQQFARRTNV